MNILLLGADGQVGWELRRSLAPLGAVHAITRRELDLSDLPAVDAFVRQRAPDVIANAAAWTAVDKAEAEMEAAALLNSGLPALLAGLQAARGGWLLHYSTDYVFDGSGTRPWTEDDPVAPLNAYGTGKAAGEQAIRDAGVRHLIFRTSWVYAARGGNFARTMLKLAGERDKLSVVADQHGAPTGAELIADVSAHALRAARAQPELSGTYHLAAAGTTTWHGYACHAIARAAAAGWPLRVAAHAVAPQATSAWPTPAQRPLNSRLDCRKLERAFGLALPPWQQGVDRVIDEWTANRPGAPA